MFFSFISKIYVSLLTLSMFQRLFPSRAFLGKQKDELPASFSEEFKNADINKELQDKLHNTQSFVTETTRWEKLRQAGEKLSESALTAGTIKSYEG